MKNNLAVGISVLLGLAGASGVFAQNTTTIKVQRPFVNGSYTDQLIIQLRDEPRSEKRQAMSAAKVSNLSKSAGMSLQAIRPAGTAAHVMKLPKSLPVTEVEKIASQLAKDSNIAFAVPDVRKFPRRTPVDTYYADQWYLYEATGGINASLAWDFTLGSASITVAVIDTGVVLTNSELTGRLLPGYDFISADPAGNCSVSSCPYATAGDGDGRDADPSDPGNFIPSNQQGVAPFENCPPNPGNPSIYDSGWHGTHIAGIIGANSNNGSGSTGVDWNTKILPVRALGKCGGYTSDIVDGMRWAAGLTVSGVPVNTNPAHVLNLSLGSVGACSNFEQQAIFEILNNTSVKAIVTSAGNSALDASLSAPGNCSGVINVGATNRSGGRASYSDFGSAVTISAPGGVLTGLPGDTGADGILSLFNSGSTTPVADSYAFFAGTSSSTPQVSGAISMMLAVNPNLNANDIRNVLVSTARAFPLSTCNTSICGAGILDLSAAVRSAATTTPTTIPIFGASTSSGSTSSSTSSGGGGGGGCTLGNGTSDISLSILSLVALLTLYRRKR